jgi:hypothetical protein
MSSLSIIEQIRLNVLTTLQGLVTAHTASIIIEPARFGLPDGLVDKALVLLQGETAEQPDEIESHKGWATTFEIYCIARPDDSTTTPIDSALNELRSQVEQALLADTSRGGLAIDTVVKSPSYYVHPKGAFMAVIATAEVLWRHAYYNPYSS